MVVTGQEGAGLELVTVWLGEELGGLELVVGEGLRLEEAQGMEVELGGLELVVVLEQEGGGLRLEEEQGLGGGRQARRNWVWGT